MSPEKTDEELQKIDLTALFRDLLHSLRRLFIPLLLIAVLLGDLSGLVSYLRYEPMYEASATFTVTVKNPLLDDTTSYNSSLARQMADTFPTIISSSILRDLILDKLDMDEIPPVAASVIDGANIFTLRVTSPNPSLAQKTLEAVMLYYPEVAEFVLGPTQLDLLSETGIPTEPINAHAVRKGVRNGVLAALLLGFILLLLDALTHTTIRSEDDLKNLTNLTCQGTLPQVKLKKGVAVTQPTLQKGSDPSGFSDSIRLLSLHIKQELERRQSKVLLISSAIPGEGKTTVSINLASALAAHGKRVLLLDLDLRSPSLEQLLNLNASQSLAQFLAKPDQPSDSIIVQVGTSSLYAILAGPPVQNAAPLLSQASLRQLVSQAAPNFDYVILDTPPCGILADAGEVADLADGALLVIRQNFSSQDQVLESVQFLSESRLPVIGCVLNGICRDAIIPVYGYGSSRYGYGYGYGVYGGSDSAHS